MERLTEKTPEGYRLSGEKAAALARLGRLEDLWEGLEARQAAIPALLEDLRSRGKDKTVSFRELMAEKLTNAAVLDAMKRALRAPGGKGTA